MAGDTGQNPRDVKPRPARSALGRLWLTSFVVHTLDLPEWKMFPSEAERRRAIADAAYGRMPGIVGGVSRPGPLALGCVILLVVVFVGLSPLTPRILPFHWHAVLSLVVYFTAGGVFVWFVHRPAVARFLRGRLADLGVPICRGCGYDLRGQVAPAVEGETPSTLDERSDGRCPECGAGWRAKSQAKTPGR